MRTVSKHSSKRPLSHAQLESLVLQRTVALQNLSQRLLTVQDEERRRVARDLHDSAGQTLTALKINVTLLQEQLEQDHSRSGLLSEIVALADQAVHEIRTTSLGRRISTDFQSIEVGLLSSRA